MPSGYPANIDFTQLFETVATSRRSITSIAKEMGYNPSTVLMELERSPELRVIETHARERQADFIVQSIFDELADCYKVVMSKDYDNVTKHSLVNACKLTIDSFKWIACKFRPNIYGDRVSVDHNLEQLQTKFRDMFTQTKIQAKTAGKTVTTDAVFIPNTEEHRILNPIVARVDSESDANGMDYHTKLPAVTQTTGQARQADVPGRQAGGRAGRALSKTGKRLHTKRGGAV